MNDLNRNSNNQPIYDGKGTSIAALICGVVSILCGFFGFFVPLIGVVVLPTSVLGIVFGVMGRGDSIKAHGKASGIATSGLILGIVAICLFPLSFICTLCVTCGIFQACTVLTL